MSAGQTPHAFLDAVPSVRRLAHVAFGAGRSATLWSNETSSTAYSRLSGHTLSLYLEGGASVRREDRTGSQGFDGALCVMPQGSNSRWAIGGAFRFVHLHWPDGELRRAYAQTFDRDASAMRLDEATFLSRPELAAPLRRAALAALAGDALAAETASAGAVASLFDGVAAAPVKGGLAPLIRRRVVERIETSLDQPLRLAELAALAEMSEFHFLRCFRASAGLPPHAFVRRRRVERAQEMLSRGEPPAQVASACGWSSQSHMTRDFRAATGVTPGAWTKARRA